MQDQRTDSALKILRARKRKRLIKATDGACIGLNLLCLHRFDTIQQSFPPPTFFFSLLLLFPGSIASGGNVQARGARMFSIRRLLFGTACCRTTRLPQNTGMDDIHVFGNKLWVMCLSTSKQAVGLVPTIYTLIVKPNTVCWVEGLATACRCRGFNNNLTFNKLLYRLSLLIQEWRNDSYYTCILPLHKTDLNKKGVCRYFMKFRSIVLSHEGR